MRKEYRSSNVRFCMDDENQRRTWEYLQSITRKEGSYGKILSDAFVQILDGNHAIEQEALQQNLSECVTEQILSMHAFSRAVSRNKLLEKYEKKIVALEKKVSDVSGLLDKMKQFISNRGLGEAFAEFVKALEPKTMKERLTEKQKVVKKQTQQKSMHTQEHGTSRKYNISTEL